MSLAAGARVGPYEVLELLGAGGMGEVYRAFDPRLGREVAVKVLPEEVGSDPERLARFEREARAVAALNHPNILTVFDVGLPRPDDTASTATAPYVVTELLEGETLRELVSRRSPTQRQVLSFALQVAHGLDAAHTKGIVHRDLKPENVFVTTDGRVKLLDFGLAKVVDRRAADSLEPTAASPTGAGQMVGTVGYMSPEQVRGLPVDARTDVFSLGVVLYELLGGKHPFRRETAVATLTAILEATPVDLVSLGRGVPPAVSGIVRRCLEKAREERYPSAHDVGVALEAVLAAPAGAALLQEVEERSPYPGLMSFTEKDAAVFFGREAEVKALWQRLESRRLLAVIGPSGAGKSSFLRAGVLPARPEGWATACATPGANPALALARALTPGMAGDAEAIGEMLAGVGEVIQRGESDRFVATVKRWRGQHAEALLVVDQFEEMFTLNAKETQERFATLLGALPSEADVHVLLSLRDDFLMRGDRNFLFGAPRDTARGGYGGGRSEAPARAARGRGRPTSAGPLGEVSAQGRVEAWGRMRGRHVGLSSRPDCGARGGSQAGVARGWDENGGGRGILSRLRRWSRMRSMSAGCVMKPITRISLPQRVQMKGSTS
jgi:hypothetical protein